MAEKPRSTTPDSDAMNPGDEAPPGTPGTGENICPKCRGTGRLGNQRCENCGGTGKIIEGIGGA
jgi:hypothetical protein